jgi:hypothetical protein
MPGRLLRAATAAAAAAVVTGCASGSAPSHRGQDPTPQSVQALRERVTGPVALSPVIDDGDGHAVALAVMKQVQRPAVPQVLLFHWDGSAWKQVETIVLDVGGSVASDDGSTTPIATADLTPAREPELLVTVYYNSGPATAVLSKYGGRWHPLTFSGGIARDGDERYDVHVRGDTLTSRENDCVPNCAQGHLVTTVFRFNPRTGRLEASPPR